MILRPKTLAQIAAQSDSIEGFGRHMRDWLHELRRISSRPEAEAAIAPEPVFLRARFPGGGVADAWLAAYGEYLAQRIGAPPPPWTLNSARIAAEPWFANDSGNLTSRILALRDTPPPFKRRNLYTLSVELPLRLRAGRPAKSPAEKRQANAKRQHRFRERRRLELAALRKIAADREPKAG